MGLWTKEQADGLLARGMITQDQYNKDQGGPVMPSQGQNPDLSIFNATPQASPTSQSIKYAPEVQQPIAPTASAQIASPQDLDKLKTSLSNQATPSVSNQTDLALGAKPQPAMDIQNAMATSPMFTAYGNAFGTQLAGINKQEQAAIQAGKEQALTLKGYQDEQNRIHLESMERQNKIQQEIDQKNAEIEQVRNDYQNMKVDPSRLWANKSTGDKIMAGIGLFLGGFGGGDNKAAKVIQSAIDQDLEQQKLAINKKGQEYTMARGVYGDMLGKLKDERAAEQAAKLVAYDHAQLQLQQIAAKTQGTQVAANADILRGQLELQKAQLGQQLQGVMLASAAQSGQASPEYLPKDQRERLVPGYGLALSGDDAKEMRQKILPAATTASQSIDELLKIDNKPGSKISPQMANDANLWVKSIIGNMREEIVGPGAVTDTEREILQSIVKDPTKITEPFARDLLLTLKKKVQMGLAAKAKSMGLQPMNQITSERPN